jgi:hypothetical protein
MSYMHPALAEHLRKRWMRPDAYRFAAPGTPEAKPPGTLHPWAEVARQEQAAADEAKARAVAEQDEFEREVLALRHELAKLRLEYELRRFQQKYSPDQPRVPAGNRDGGQWTSGGGAQGTGDAGDDGAQSILDIVSQDSLQSTPAALNDRASSRVDLSAEEARGGHTIEKHVNRSPEALVAQVREVFDERPYARNVHSGSFSSLEAATKLVNSTLAQNQDIVDKVASGLLSEKTVFAQFNSITGIEAVAAHIGSQVSIRETYGVGVLVVHDPSSPRGYIIWSAFPSNKR